MNPLKHLPKAELHRHLEGAIRLETVKELAQAHGLDLPADHGEFREKVLVTRPMENLGVVLGKFWLTQSVLSTEEILERITFEAVEDAYNEGIRVLELRYAPNFILENHPNLTFDSIHQSILRGLERAKKQFPMAVGLIGIVVRVDPMDECESVANFIIDNRDTFLAIDLAGDEAGYPCKTFAPLFMKAKKAGLRVTVHSGEADQPGAAEFVRDAIECLGAERIGHGVQIYRDPKMIEFVKSEKVVLELCPTSNWLTNAVKNLGAHPIRFLGDQGVAVTVNSDDPGLFGIDLTNEYHVLHNELGFSVDELRKLADEAARHSFIPIEERRKVWPGL
ncbi:MAG TPA: adenosine deaminase [Bdellovibrionales bacterium]|nr:adenosine deaminase [Bdellovibrionales bacterium]